MRSPTTQTIFEAITDSIVEQQISLRIATAIERKIVKKFGDPLNIEDSVYYGYPSPQSLASASLQELRGCGLSGRKAEYIRDLAKLVAGGQLNLERYKDYGNADDIIR